MSKRHQRRQAARAARAASSATIDLCGTERTARTFPPNLLANAGWFGLDFDLAPEWEDDIETLRRVPAPAPDDEFGWVEWNGALLLLAARQTPRGWDYLVGDSAWEGRLAPLGVLTDNLIHPDSREGWIRAAKLLNETLDLDRADRAHGRTPVHLTWAQLHAPDEFLDLVEDDEEDRGEDEVTR